MPALGDLRCLVGKKTSWDRPPGASSDTFSWPGALRPFLLRGSEKTAATASWPLRTRALRLTRRTIHRVDEIFEGPG